MILPPPSLKRRTLLSAGLGLMTGKAWASQDLQWDTRAMQAMGTTVTVRAAHPNGEHLQKALSAAMAIIRQVEASMSLYRPDSELSRLNRDGVLASPSAMFLTLTRTALAVARASHGAFDPTVQPLWSLHAKAQEQGRLASSQEIGKALRNTGWQDVLVVPERIQFRRPAMAMTFNGIAQGYATDAAREVLRERGIQHALVDAGEWAGLGSNPQAQPWTLGLEDPRTSNGLTTTLALQGRCLATSGDSRSSFTDDHRLHHILDTRTGLSPTSLASVTVIAASTTLADALTKVMFMAEPSRLAGLARAWGVDVLWVEKAGRAGSTLTQVHRG